MRVHHLNCGTMCPPLQRLLLGTGRLLSRGRIVCHCLLVETDEGLVLIDTGFGLGDLRSPERLCATRHLLSPRFEESETAIRQIEALGFTADDVRHIVLTHLDLDHAGGLGDFPRAKVHALRRERDAAANPAPKDRARYRTAQWAHDPDWSLYDVDGGRFFGFEAVRDLVGLPPEILLVPLHGHSAGHAGVAVDTDSGWLLHAGDAYFFHAEMDPDRPHCPPGFRAFQSLVAFDDARRKWNQRRLQALVREHRHEVRVFSAHDSAEFASFG
ncbi:MAG: MBL fold metallo-hydrolase [Deltaproteobacteria bacterium]|nr:MBL fold metallo-hydrolase [Deltaproteobacteria bacterium]